jgi:hypothetical protein
LVAKAQSATVQAAAGWPQKIAGRITGTPAAADLDGNGKLELVLPVWSSDGAAQLMAYEHDGKPVRNWPVVFFTAEQTKQRHPASPHVSWFGSPSAMDLDRDGTDEIVMPLPDGEPRGIRILFGGGEPWPWTFNAPADPWVSVPLVDLNNDRVVDLILGQVHTTVQNKPVPGWPETRMLHGYAPCVGDADGDGDLEFYQPDYQNHWHLEGQPAANSLSGNDHQGNAYPAGRRKSRALPCIRLWATCGATEEWKSASPTARARFISGLTMASRCRPRIVAASTRVSLKRAAPTTDNLHWPIWMAMVKPKSLCATVTPELCMHGAAMVAA